MRINILIATNDDAEFEELQEKLAITFDKSISVERVTQEITAKEMELKSCDIVFLGRNVPSPWSLIDTITKNTQFKTPKFYLNSNAQTLINDEAIRAQYSGVIGVTKDGSFLARQGYKDANRYDAQPVENTPATKISIGSIGKMLTSIAIATLVEANKLDYDTPIRDSLAKLPDCPERYKEIFSKYDFTPRQLLTHTAGLNDNIGKIYEFSLGADIFSFERVEDYVSHCAPLTEQTFETKGEHRYSNLGYFILGLAIEAIEGNYYDYVQEHVLTPANMQNTVSKRTSGVEFALPNLKELERDSKDLLPVQPPVWLTEMARDITYPDLNISAKQTLMWFEYAKKSIETYSESLAVLARDYQIGLATVSEADFPVFRAQLIERIKGLDINFNEHAEIRSNILALCRKLHEEVMSTPAETQDARFQKVDQLDHFLMERLHQSLANQSLTIEYFFNSLSIAHPAGCWYSTVDDLAAFDQSLQSGVLAKYRAQLTEQSVGAPNAGTGAQYGNGCSIFHNPTDAHYNLGHDGGMPGGLARYRQYPNVGMTLIMLSNENNFSQFYAPDGLSQRLEENLIVPPSHIRYFDAQICDHADALLKEDIQEVLRQKSSLSAATAPSSSAFFKFPKPESKADNPAPDEVSTIRPPSRSSSNSE